MPKKPAATEQEQELRSRIGASIRMRGAVAGMKASDVAKAAGVSLAHQYRIEAGERTPDALYLIKVAQLLGISIDDLCGMSAEENTTASDASVLTQTASGTGIIQVGGDASRNRTSIRNKRNKNFLD
jgi:transcriptional regulator with XRE-family HTH domain